MKKKVSYYRLRKPSWIRISSSGFLPVLLYPQYGCCNVPVAATKKLSLEQPSCFLAV